MQNRANHSKVRRLTVSAMLTALIWFLAFTPLGFTIPFFGISMTFVHIPMIVGTLMEGLSVGTVLGGMFGLTSLVKNITQPTSIYSPMFQNPLVSVLPRLLIAPVCYGVLVLMRKLFPGKVALHFAVASVFGALANTAFTLSAMSISLALASDGFSGVSYASIWALAANCPIECVSACVVCTAILLALRPLYKTKQGESK